MAVFRVEKNKGYTVMSNHHLRNKELTLKAKGLLSQMLSLLENWDYTLAGLSHINKESIDAIRTAVWELEKAGYIKRSQGRDEKGKMTAITYTIYEQPQSSVPKNPTSDKPVLENPTSENPMQLNKDIQKTDLSKKEKINKDGLNTDSIPILSPDPSPLSEQPLPEKNGKEEKDAYKIYEELIKDNIEYEHLINTKRLDRDCIDEILDLILETVCSKIKGDGEKAAEDFWTKSERLFYCALIGYIFYEAPEEEKNFTTLLEMINASEAREDDPEFQSPVDLMFQRLEEKDPEHFAVRQYKKFLLSAGKTRSSILISCGARLIKCL